MELRVGRPPTPIFGRRTRRRRSPVRTLGVRVSYVRRREDPAAQPEPSLDHQVEQIVRHLWVEARRRIHDELRGALSADPSARIRLRPRDSSASVATTFARAGLWIGEMDSPGRRTMKSHGFLMVLSLILAGCDSATVAGERPERVARPIFNGVVVADHGFEGTPQLLTPDTACSAVVYSRHWVITAAHCLSARFESNGDGYISDYEVDEPFHVRFLQTDSGTIGERNVFVAVKHPTAVWGDTTGVDVAMLYLDPTSAGVSMPDSTRTSIRTVGSTCTRARPPTC